MNAIFGIVLQAAAAFILTASAQSPAAVVEEIQGSVPGIAFMDYVEPGQIIRLGAHDRIMLGYLKSCWRETISGGTVTVGPEQSEVAGGDGAREGGVRRRQDDALRRARRQKRRHGVSPSAEVASGRRRPASGIHALWTAPGLRSAAARQACCRTPGSARRTPRDRRHRATTRARRILGFRQIGRGARSRRSLPG